MAGRPTARKTLHPTGCPAGVVRATPDVGANGDRTTMGHGSNYITASLCGRCSLVTIARTERILGPAVCRGCPTPFGRGVFVLPAFAYRRLHVRDGRQRGHCSCFHVDHARPTITLDRVSSLSDDTSARQAPLKPLSACSGIFERSPSAIRPPQGRQSTQRCQGHRCYLWCQTPKERRQLLSRDFPMGRNNGSEASKFSRTWITTGPEPRNQGS